VGEARDLELEPAVGGGEADLVELLVAELAQRAAALEGRELHPHRVGAIVGVHGAIGRGLGGLDGRDDGAAVDAAVNLGQRDAGVEGLRPLALEEGEGDEEAVLLLERHHAGAVFVAHALERVLRGIDDHHRLGLDRLFGPLPGDVGGDEARDGETSLQGCAARFHDFVSLLAGFFVRRRANQPMATTPSGARKVVP